MREECPDLPPGPAGPALVAGLRGAAFKIGIGRRRMLASLAAASSFAATAPARAAGETVKIGVLTDMDGPFSGVAGPGSVLAARMAVQDYGGRVAGKPISVVLANHQNKPDIASTIARQWYDQDGVDLIVDVVGSPIALAVQDVARQRQKMLIVHGASTLKLTGEACSETGVLWVYSSYSNAKALATSTAKSGGTGWYFLTLDNEGGSGVQAALLPFVSQAGGTVVGTSRFPLTETDFSSYLLQAQASNPDVIAVASAGGTLVSILKQADEFHTLKPGAKFLLPFSYITEIHEIGLQAAKGTLLVEPFYWDMNDGSRAFATRFLAQLNTMPNSVQAGVYTSIQHYLKAVDRIGTTEGVSVAAAMREMPINDFMTRNGRIRADGDVDRERFVFEVKAPEESRRAFDYYKLARSFAPDETTRPLAESPCPLLRHPG